MLNTTIALAFFINHDVDVLLSYLLEICALNDWCLYPPVFTLNGPEDAH